MSTLKKVLALTLVFAMALTFMAGAFTDSASIDNKTAVDMASALGIIKGYPDGSFGPDKIVTRAEMAKMIYIVKNGKDDGATYYANAVNPFYDTVNHWAKGYINYCYSLGIIAGKGAGKFDPDAPVTGLEAAKMALTIIGYNATKAGLVGAQWALNTASLATENGLFDDYGADIAVGAPRQSAAQIIYNTLFANLQVWSNDLNGYTEYVNNSDETITIGEKYMGLETYEGILIGADGFVVDNDANGGEDMITVDGNEDEIEDYMDFEIAGYKDMVGQNVKVIYKSSNNKVYGIISAGDNEVYDTTAGSIDAATKETKDIKFGGKEYSVSANNVYVNYDDASVVDFEAVGLVTEDPETAKLEDALYNLNSNDPVKLVDNDGNGTIDYIFLTHYTFGKVDRMDDKDADIIGAAVLNFEDDIDSYYDGMAAGDYVLFYEDMTSEKYSIIKASSVSGKLTGLTGTTLTTIKLNGSNISMSTFAAELGDAINNPVNNGTYTVYTDGKYWLGCVDATESGDTGKYVFVNKAQNKFVDTVAFANKDPKVEVVMPGEDDPVSYVVDSCKYLDGETLTSADLKVDLNTDEVVGQIFAYSITDAGKIKLSQDFSPLPKSGALTYTDSTNIVKVDGTSAKLGADTVIFYQKLDGSIAIYSTSDMDKSITADDTATGFMVYANSSIKSAKAVLITSAGKDQTGAASGELYGFVTDFYTGVNDDDEDYVEYTIWNGASVTLRSYDVLNVTAKNILVAYKLKGNGEIMDIEKVVSANYDNAATATGDRSDNLGRTDKFNVGQIKSTLDDLVTIKVQGVTETIYQITDDTKIIAIDTDAIAGKAAPSTLPKVGVSDGASVWNIFYVIDNDHPEELLWVFIDTHKDLNAID